MNSDDERKAKEALKKEEEAEKLKLAAQKKGKTLKQVCGNGPMSITVLYFCNFFLQTMFTILYHYICR